MLYTLQPRSLPRVASRSYHYIYLSMYLRFVVLPAGGGSLLSLPLLPGVFAAEEATSARARTRGPPLLSRLIETAGYRSRNIEPSMPGSLTLYTPDGFHGSSCARWRHPCREEAQVNRRTIKSPLHRPPCVRCAAPRRAMIPGAYLPRPLSQRMTINHGVALPPQPATLIKG